MPRPSSNAPPTFAAKPSSSADPSADRLAARHGRRARRGAAWRGLARHCPRRRSPPGTTSHASASTGSPLKAGSPTRRWLHSIAGRGGGDPAGAPVRATATESADLGRSDVRTMPVATLEALLPLLRRLADDPNSVNRPTGSDAPSRPARLRGMPSTHWWPPMSSGTATQWRHACWRGSSSWQRCCRKATNPECPAFASTPCAGNGHRTGRNGAGTAAAPCRSQ